MSQKIADQKRLAYQRKLMRERRARIAKVIGLHERSKEFATAPQRQAMELKIQRILSAARDRHVEGRGRLSWKERNAARNAFWGAMDTVLDRRLREIDR